MDKTSDKIRKLPVGTVHDLLQHGARIEIGDFRFEMDNDNTILVQWYDDIEDYEWNEWGSYPNTIDGVTRLLLEIADEQDEIEEREAQYLDELSKLEEPNGGAL